MSEQLHKTIHVVQATTGEHESVESWSVVAYEDEELARRHAHAAALYAAEMLAVDTLKRADNTIALRWDAKLVDVQEPGTTYEVKPVLLRDTLPADDDNSEALETTLIRTLKRAAARTPARAPNTVLIRDAALEEAAQLCDGFAAGDFGGHTPNLALGFAAYEIRKLRVVELPETPLNKEATPIVQVVVNVRCKAIIDHDEAVIDVLRPVLGEGGAATSDVMNEIMGERLLPYRPMLATVNGETAISVQVTLEPASEAHREMARSIGETRQ